MPITFTASIQHISEMATLGWSRTMPDIKWKSCLRKVLISHKPSATPSPCAVLRLPGKITNGQIFYRHCSMRDCCNGPLSHRQCRPKWSTVRSIICRFADTAFRDSRTTNRKSDMAILAILSGWPDHRKHHDRGDADDGTWTVPIRRTHLWPHY